MLGLHYVLQLQHEILYGTTRYHLSVLLSFFILFSLLSFIVCLDLCHLDVLECLGYFFLKMPIAIFMSSKAKRLQLPWEQGASMFMRIIKKKK